jgi:hypothetical protein
VATSLAIAVFSISDAGASTSRSRPFGSTTSPPARPAVLSSSVRSGCDRPSSSTLLETGKVRVYAMPKESASHPERHEPAIAGRPVFGCLQANGMPRLLDLPEVAGEKHAYWVEVDSQALAVTAPLVAYAYTEYYLDTHQTWIRVRNLRTGVIVRGCEAGGGLAPGRSPHISEIVLDSQGAVAWSAEGSEGRVVRACGAAGSRILDAGEGVDLGSLTLDHGVVSWVDEGSIREAALEQTPPEPPGRTR